MLIYDVWDEKHSDALAKKMLESDVKKLGLYFGTVDEFGQLAELTLVAECVAHIRTFDSGVDQTKMIDYWTDVVMEELLEVGLQMPVDATQTMEEIVASMQTWIVTKELYDRGRVTMDLAGMLVQSYIELADVFFMRDGNITSEEMQAMRELEAALSLR